MVQDVRNSAAPLRAVRPWDGSTPGVWVLDPAQSHFEFGVKHFWGLMTRALSRNPDPARASRPFDRARDGFVGTGGSVALLLEDEEAARERGASVYAELLGWGQASDGHLCDPQGHRSGRRSGQGRGRPDGCGAHPAAHLRGAPDTGRRSDRRRCRGDGRPHGLRHDLEPAGHGLVQGLAGRPCAVHPQGLR